MLAADLQTSLMMASTDLDRLQGLLSDATETLMGHFQGASQQIKKLSLLAALHPGLPASDLQLALGHLSGAVTTLQFQDMASQLIAHTHRRLRHCADRLARAEMGDDEVGAAGEGRPGRGATGWLVKPFDPAKLIEVIGKVIR